MSVPSSEALPGEAPLPGWSPVTTDVDFDTEGRQVGSIFLPVAGMPEAMRIPILVLKNGAGPTVLLTGAVHGDEYEGPIALSNLARDLAPSGMRGRIIIVPFLNRMAMDAAKRRSPLDNLDLNRSFPGTPDGTPTQVLAHWVATRLVPLADAVVDCHTGGTWSNWVPLVMMHPVPDPALHSRMLDLVTAMRAPVGVVLNESDKPGMFDSYVEARGKPFVCCEFGGGTPTLGSLRIAAVCLRNALRHLGLCEGAPETPEWTVAPCLMQAPDLDWAVSSPIHGLHEPLVELGAEVAESTLIGRVHPFDSLLGEPLEIRAPVSGRLIFRPASSRVKPGQRVAMMARPLVDG